MATSTNVIRGKSGLIFTLQIGAGTATSYADDIKEFELSNEDADDSDVTFAEALAGLNKVWTLSVTALQAGDAASLYRYLWANPGATFNVKLGPAGNATPSTTKPHYSFVANATGKPPVSNAASTSTERSEFEYEFSVVGDVTEVTA